MSRSRIYSTRRQAIATALMELFNTIDGTGDYSSNLTSKVYSKLKFFSEVPEFPAVCIVCGSETRDYQTAQYRDRYLDIKIIIFVNQENPLEATEAILEDLETVIEDNGQLTYYDKNNTAQKTHDITILSLSTDEGTLDPISIGEMSIRVHY